MLQELLDHLFFRNRDNVLLCFYSCLESLKNRSKLVELEKQDLLSVTGGYLVAFSFLLLEELSFFNTVLLQNKEKIATEK